MYGCVKAAAAAMLFVAALGCGSGGRTPVALGSVAFETTTVPAAGAGQLYNATIRFTATGGAALPERFVIVGGSLPPGVQLVPDRVDGDADGLPDTDGALTGHARLLGFPREPGSFKFTIRAVSTGGLANPGQPDFAATAEFTVNVGEGSVAILTPTAAEGTSDPAVPAFPEVISFVNPANPNAFFSFAWQIAGGSNKNLNNIYMPRELELSTFDASVAVDDSLLDFDTDESVRSGSKYEPSFVDGGLFVLQAGNQKVQVGGFQSPRGPVGTITRHKDGAGLDPAWFQVSPGAGGPAQNSRRTFADTTRTGGDAGLGTPQPVRFSDYFDIRYEDTFVGATPRRKYPFAASEYTNAFFVPFTTGVDLTPLRFRVIVESIDTRGTVTNRNDDVIFRKAYVVNVRIPDVVIDTVVLPGATAGVDYTVFVAASGGVPPLRFELEHVDGVADGEATANGPGQLTKQDFGIELNRNTGQFFGVPRASGPVDLTVRVYADVMNPTQDGPQPVPTGNPGELDGTHPVTGKTGRHKTFTIQVAAPLPLLLTNAGLKPGIDGFLYQGDTLVGAGGVARLQPYPVGFAGTYPTATALRNYAWQSSYIRDASHGPDAGTVDPARQLPNALQLDGNPTSGSNGAITGTPFDRGFHPVTITQTDTYLGAAAAPSAANALSGQTTLTLSISPDVTLFMRGRAASEGSGGEATGLLDSTLQTGEPRMVPMFLASSVYTVETGSAPALQGWLPAQMDLLPVILPHGGNDEHNRKSIPSVSGFWPAEAGSEPDWNITQERAWKHLQQEMTWIQAPNARQSRVFLWAETRTKKWDSNATDWGWSKRYQQYLSTGKRGVMVVDPLTGGFHVPAILDNNSAVHGTQFGAEAVVGGHHSNPALGTYTNSTVLYSQPWKFYYYVEDNRWDREMQTQGLGSFLEPFSASGNSSAGWYRDVQGRSATSLAMSADGTWCATAMPGGSEQKILLFRTDGQALPAALLAKTYVTSLQGRNADGSVMANTVACIVNPGGNVNAGGVPIAKDQRHLLPDSLMFVQNGLLFLNEPNLDHVFGLSLVNGALTSRDLNSRSAVNGAGVGPNVVAARGMFVPDADSRRGMMGALDLGTQFAFAGNEPAAGSTGPSKVAFVAGDNRTLLPLVDLPGQPRAGYQSQANRNKSLLFLEMSAPAATGLDLGAAATVLKDLTGSSPLIYGDLLPPGRPGEDMDFLAVSKNGDYVAVVRDFLQGTDSVSSGFTTGGTFHTTLSSMSTSTTPTTHTTDDLLLISTTGADMDAGANNTQHILYVGSGSFIPNTTTDPAGLPAYVTGKAYLNAGQRRISGVEFGADDRTLIFKYSGGALTGSTHYNPKYAGLSSGWPINPVTPSISAGTGTQVSLRLTFRTAANQPINFGSVGSNMANNLDGLSGVGGIGPTAPGFNETTAVSTSQGSQQMFWSHFRSPNGNFLYYISDSISGRNFMVGINTSAAAINGRQPYTPFSTHAATVGFEQFDMASFNYENRFAAVPGGVVFSGSGRDGSGLVCVIASDATAGATNSVDLEVYAFDANLGGDLVALTSAVTTGTANALNYLTLSANGNVLVGQRAKTTLNSRTSRTQLTGNSDLFVVTNVHAAVYGGATPDAFILSAGRSHGSSVAFVGEGTAAGPQALVYSSATSGGNTTWVDRNLQIVLLQNGAVPDVLDTVSSHYAVLGAGRKLDDNFNTSN